MDKNKQKHLYLTEIIPTFKRQSSSSR